MLSPRMRGWSWIGVILVQKFPSYPRECGGDPINVQTNGRTKLLSPRMRGWSCSNPTFCADRIVIPANAGVILHSALLQASEESYPRECGGDPAFGGPGSGKTTLSPRMRGWSLSGVHIFLSFIVVPANAGVILCGEDLMVWAQLSLRMQADSIDMITL